MQIIYDKKDSGKTAQLIAMASNYDGYIVCVDSDTVIKIFDRAVEDGININYPLTYSEFINDKYLGRRVEHVYIDDAENLLKYMSKVHIKAITLTKQ